VVEAAHHGDPQARALLEDAGRQIGRALATAVNVLNPEAVIIGGRLSQVTDLIVTPLAASLRESILPAFRDDLVIEASDLREEAGPLGAGALAFHEMLQANPRTLQQYV
ncbi:MAG: ROK family protein, partial [Candidatus Sumerlaeia bacterium]|nr:ROK family protein [Candidatus Sumerlaeia bacterium]